MTGAEILTGWLLIVAVNTAATMSPGPAFAMTVRNAMAYDRRAGIFTAMGLGAGVGVIAFLVLFGFAAVISQSAMLFNAVRYAGATYLIYIGGKALFAKQRSVDSEPRETQRAKAMTDLTAFKSGLFTSLLNPKGIVFFTAVYAQFLTPGMPWPVLVLYGFTTMVIETVWFSMVAAVLTNSLIKGRFLRFSHWIERLCGGLLLALGIRLALSKGL